MKLRLNKRSAEGASSQSGALSPIGVEFGASSLKAIQVTGETPDLVAAACLPTPDELLDRPIDRLGFQLENLPRMIRRGGFRSKRIACVVPGDRLFCKHMQCGRSEGVEISDLLRVAVPQELGCGEGALVIRHIEVEGVERPTAGGKSEVICLAAPREIVTRQMDALRAAKLEPVGIQHEFSCVLAASAPREADPATQPATTLYLDIGWSRTGVMLAHGRSIVFARMVELGGRHLDETVRDQLGVSMEKAREIRQNLKRLTPEGDPPPPAEQGLVMLSAAMRKAGASPASRSDEPDLSEPLDMLRDEVAACLRYHESLFPSRRVENVAIVGGEARHKALGDYLSRALRLPGGAVDPLGALGRTGREPSEGLDLASPQPGWVVALGACLSTTDL
ncbi:MAG: pilus assembly protein PilM [Phycisphaerales bacterium]|nr:pilus assembly protein PilM [Phycisphaerales bacterium]